MDEMTDDEQKARHDIGGSAYVELYAALNRHLNRAPESVRLLIAVEVLANMTSTVLTGAADAEADDPARFRRVMTLLEDYFRAVRRNIDQHLLEPRDLN